MSFNSSGNKFLDRFAGKVGILTKHGQLINRNSFQSFAQSRIKQSNYSSLHLKQNSKIVINLPRINKQKISQSQKLSKTMQRSEVSASNIIFQQKQQKQNVKTSTGLRSVKPKQTGKAFNSLISQQNAKYSSKNMKNYNLPWQIKEMQTIHFYEQLTNLKLSKATSFKHNPLVHL